jgi:hypothetical protein
VIYIKIDGPLSLSIGAPLGNLEGGSFTGDFERWMKGVLRGSASLSVEALCEENLEGGPLYWGPQRIC